MLILVVCLPLGVSAQGTDYLRMNYEKKEVRIPMRDGVTLFTAIYSPRDISVKYPILFVKTPYGLKNYGPDNYPESIGPSEYLAREKFIIVYQEARGTFLSEGIEDQMAPHLPSKPDPASIDHSSDTYDAVDWLIKNTNTNGKVGIWGISYRGFYASSGIIDAHPAIVCSSPQAPIADWFAGDDLHHNGAFALMGSFLFFEIVGIGRDSLTTAWPVLNRYPNTDAYNFFLNCGKTSELAKKYYSGHNSFWDSIIAHPNYDDYWQKRNILPHLKNIRPAVMVTGGLFDHENLYGSLKTYEHIKNKSANETRLVLGPWIHGGWSRTTGDSLGFVKFGSATSDLYQQKIELPFFNYHLKQKGNLENLTMANIFFTGQNSWEEYSVWPPDETQVQTLYLNDNFSLTEGIPKHSGPVYDDYISDPRHPVPYTQVFHSSRLFYNKEYMSEDQRFASSRPDVLTYETGVLTDTLTLAGPLVASIFAASTGSDFDLIVKLIDVYPSTTNTAFAGTAVTDMAGFQQLVRAEIMRAKYRNSLSDPEPIIPGNVEKISLELNDIAHSFLPGHKVMIQIQSSWFPLYDRNPHVFTDIYQADEKDYQKAGIQIYRSEKYPSSIRFHVLQKTGNID
jgi:hypothetical protein